MASFSFVFPAVIAFFFFAASSSRNDGCQWRFDDCNILGADSECVVRLRLWCGCLVNTSCASNATREVNATAARALASSVYELCNVSSCAVRPRDCEWTPWTVTYDTCVRQTRRRTRERCCHPVHRTPINSSLYPALEAKCDLESQGQRRTSERFASDCVILPVDPPRDKGSSDGNPFGFNYAVIVIFVFVGLFALFCAWLRLGGPFRRTPPVERQPPPAPAPDKPAAPTIVFVPQPGWPLDEAQPLTK